MPDKIKLEAKNGKAVITEGSDSFLGKLLIKQGKIKIHKQGRTAEIDIVQPKSK